MDNWWYALIGLIPLLFIVIRFMPAIKILAKRFKFIAKEFMEPDPVSKRIKEEEENKKRKQDAEVAQEVEFKDISEKE